MRSRLAVCPAFLICALAGTSIAQQFNPGHYYTPMFPGTIVEWDPSLQEVHRFSVPGVTSVTGAVFTPNNTLLFLGYRQNSEQVIEIDAAGSILHSYTAGGTLLGGSYLAVDPVTGMYAFANGTRVTVLNQQLQVVASTPVDFTRVSGVTFNSSGHLFADDSSAAGIREYAFNGSSLAFAASHPALNFSNLGMQWCADNSLLFARLDTGDLARLNLTGDTTSVIPTGLGGFVVHDVHQLDTGNILVSAGDRLYTFTATGQPLNQSAFPGDHMDGVAVFVPAPATGVMTSMLLLVCARRRRR
jgi:hypothetical protein